jgi:nicotinamidase-related amidase
MKMEKKENTALLVMDLQAGILANLPDKSVLTNPVAKAIAAARSEKIPVIFVRVGFRPGLPEASKNNKNLMAMKERFTAMNMDDFMKFESPLIPLPEDLSVIKRRLSAFTGSDLEVILRAKNIHHIVLTGLSTSGVVLSTLREAADKDYRITVLSDGCADIDAEVHRVLTTKVFPRQADVHTVDEWIAS